MSINANHVRDILSRNILADGFVPIMDLEKSKGSYIIAYEPVWAIGSGITPNIDEIKEMFVNIKYILKSSGNNDDIKILYWGSVNINNSLEILSCDEVNGALIGGTSLNADEFSSICLDVK